MMCSLDARPYDANMPLTCNIDAKGKLARLIWGILLLVAGTILAIAWAWGTTSPMRWGLVIVCLVGGAFAVFEARAGWCVVRAMGIKTPL